MSNPPLTKQKQKWVKNRSGIVLRGSQLNYSAAQQAKYRKAILTLVRQMSKETKDQLAELFKSEALKDYAAQQKKAATDASITSKAKKITKALKTKFEALFALKAGSISETMVNGAQQVSKSNLHASLKKLSGGLSLKTGVIPKGMEEVSNAIVAENVALIKSIPSQYFTDITGSVMRSITTGARLSVLVSEIQKYDGITERRARNIALDQTRKAYNSINKQRMQAIGVKQFEWVHSGGGQHPRKSHEAMDGNIYSFDKLPVINREQVDSGYEGPVTGIPGQAINCKCTMVPVVEF